ncbi:MAG: hypothetical protein RL685_996 [Pseudomonadota bacterium]|jgi:ribosomal protein S12 methylthiotransferase accessory factor
MTPALPASEQAGLPSRWVTFVGPCLPELGQGEHPWGVAAEPIRRGDLPRWLSQGYRRFAIIDGEFGQNLSVSVLEIREALAQGAVVVGASSMGALRAAEASPLGMLGVGWIYEQYARGTIDSDEEVALTFDPDAGHRALTVPLVNLRWAVQQSWSESALTVEEAAELLQHAAAIDYRDRSWGRLLRSGRGLSPRLDRFLSWAAQNAAIVDRKRLDAQQLLQLLQASQPWPAPVRATGSAPALPRETRQPGALELWGSAATSAKLGLSHRQLHPSSAMLRAESLASRCGVSRVAEITGLDPLGVHCFSSIRPFAEAGDFTVTGGKGFSRDAARLSAVAEACERACLSPRGLPLVRASLQDLSQAHRVLHPRALILDQRSRWSAEDELAWWTARDLVSDEELWLPAAAVFYPLEQGNSWLFNCNTSGTALGASYPEALLYGLLEVVERDQLAYAELARRSRRLDLGSVRDAQCVQTLAALNARNIIAHCWVVEHDYPFPLFYMILEDQEQPDCARLVGGLGCHLDPVAGFKAALLEAVYSRLTVISGAREDIERDLTLARSIGYEAQRALALAWDSTGPDVALDALPDLSGADIATDLAFVASACQAAGLGRLLCTDLSPEGSELKVARVVAVGAEQAYHEHTRLGGRALRWLRQVNAAAAQ